MEKKSLLSIVQQDCNISGDTSFAFTTYSDGAISTKRSQLYYWFDKDSLKGFPAEF